MEMSWERIILSQNSMTLTRNPNIMFYSCQMDLTCCNCMLNLKVSRECDQALQEDHDLPREMFGLESNVEMVETLVISTDADPLYVGVRGMGGVGKTPKNIWESQGTLPFSRSQVHLAHCGANS